MIRPLASRANRWVPCPGSVAAEAAIPDVDTPETLRGKLIHKNVNAFLQGWSLGLYADTDPIPVFEDLDAGENLCAAAMIDDVISRYAQPDLQGVDAASTLALEHRLPAVYMPDGGESLSLIVDAAYWHPKRGRIIVWDFKSGFTGADAASDYQLLAGGMAIRDLLFNSGDLDGQKEQSWRLELRRVQPRAFSSPGPVSVAVYNLAECRGLFNKLTSSAAAALSDNPPVQSGTQCYGCRALVACKAARKAAEQVIRYADTLQILDVEPAQQAAAAYDLRPGLKLLTKLVEAMEQNAITVLENGGQVDGWVLDRSGGKSVWAVPDDQLIDMLALYGIDAKKPPAAKAIGDLAVACKRAQIDLAELGLTKKTAGTVKLTPVAKTAAAAAFNKGGSV